MKRKFKHYATDEIRDFDVKSSHARIDGKFHKLVEFNKNTRAEGTSWVVYND